MFELHRFEERSPDGLLKSVGIEWTENREELRKLVFGLMVLSIVAGTIVAFFVAAFVRPWWACMALGITMMSPMFFLERLSLRGRPREFVFHRDGRMEAPLGFQAYESRHKTVPGHHSAVVSIEAQQTASTLEARQTPFSNGVAMYMRDGDVAYVAGRLHRDSARKLAVQLTLALKDLTEDMAKDTASRAKVHQVSPRGSQRREMSDTIID